MRLALATNLRRIINIREEGLAKKALYQIDTIKSRTIKIRLPGRTRGRCRATASNTNQISCKMATTIAAHTTGVNCFELPLPESRCGVSETPCSLWPFQRRRPPMLSKSTLQFYRTPKDLVPKHAPPAAIWLRRCRFVSR